MQFSSYVFRNARRIAYANNNKLRFMQTASSSSNANDVIDDVFEREFVQRKIGISNFQRTLLAFGSSIAAILDPRRHDMIACLGETTGVEALNNVLQKMKSSDEGQMILKDKPRINSKTVDLKELASMPHNTFGYHYSKFLTDNNVTPDSRLDVRFMDDPTLAYVMTRYRESHDLIHTILGMPTNMLGEIAVKWVEALNIGLPMCYGGAIFGAVRLKPKHRQLYQKYFLPWSIETGKQLSQPLLNIYWEKRWNQDINEMRSELNVKVLQIKV